MHRARLLSFVVCLAGVLTLPRWWCGRVAASYWHGESAASLALAQVVAADRDGTSAEHFSTGSERFDGEWQFGTHQMAALGFGHVALQVPERRAWALAEMERSLERALSPAARAFDRAAWGEDPLESLAETRGHVAYLGYVNLALALCVRLEPDSSLRETHERITDALVRRFRRATFLETYPGEIYPVDNAAALSSIALSGRADALVTERLQQFRAQAVDRETGLVIQSLRADGSELDAPRASGSALAVYFLSWADAELAHALFSALSRQVQDSVLGFGVLREYPRGRFSGFGDIDSGPLVLGYSISASGFMLAGCRTFGDPACLTPLLRTFYLFGAPDETAGGRFLSGGPLGNAILFAMLTAPPRALVEAL